VSWHACLPADFPANPLTLTSTHPALLLSQLNTLSQMHRLLAGAAVTPRALVHYCAFVWAWMFEEYARGDWPRGRFVLLADMSGLKLGQAVGEGQVSVW
jgi:hypothetical protein